MRQGKTAAPPSVNCEPINNQVQSFGCALSEEAALPYIRPMHAFLLILLGADMIAVIAVLLFGAVGMTSANANPRRQNMLMRWRVGLQAVAIMIVVILLLSNYR